MPVRRLDAHRYSGIVLALLAAPAVAQPPESGPGNLPADADARPRIGLVLSGGGARGGAHVGVLKALDEMHVPIDFIAGTSIGAAVGGLYASGMSAAEIQEFIEGIDWNAAFLNTTPRKFRSFRRKREDDLYLVRQKPGLNHGEFQLPTGLVQGQVIDTIMSRVTLGVAGIDDFDKLAIPFRAVAGDLATGEAVILRSGNLGRSIRASMAVPAALTPMEIDGRLLVDGGIAMNLPVEVAKAMGADIVIAVDITERLAGRDKLNSVVAVTAQLTNLVTRAGMAEQIALLDDDDVLLTPDLGDDLGSVAFDRMAETIPHGYAAAMEQRDRLAALALDPEAYAAHVAARGDPRAKELPTIDFVRIENDSPVADNIIEARMAPIELGAPLDLDNLEESLNRIYGLDLFQTVRYELVEENDQTGLDIQLTSRSWGPNYAQLGVQYSSASDQDTVFGLAASYVRTEVNRQNGELRATLTVGDEPGFLTNLYQPLGPRGYFFFEPAFEYDSSLRNVFDGDELVAELQQRQVLIKVAGGRELPGWGEVRGGIRIGRGDTKKRVGEAPFPLPYDFDRGEFYARVSADTLDDIAFPTTGLLTTIEWVGSRDSVLGADSSFDQMLLRSVYAKSWGRYTLLTTFRYDATISGETPFSDLPRIGGFFDLSGLNREQFAAQNVARVGASYYRRVGDLALFPAFVGLNLELGNAWDQRSDISFDSAILGGAIWAGVDTPVGPIYLSYGRAEGGRSAIYVVLGRVF